jgi:hypothetical protein
VILGNWIFDGFSISQVSVFLLILVIMKCTMLKENLHCLGQHIQLIGVEGGDSGGISETDDGSSLTPRKAPTCFGNQGFNLLTPMNPVFTRRLYILAF